MEACKLYEARIQVVEAMEQGLPWHEAVKQAGLPISQSTAYRLRQRMRKAGEQALREGRHGHPSKLRGEVRTFLEETCRQAPSTPSHEIQTQLAERFALRISVSQINRVRATLGISNPPQSAKKNCNPRQSKSGRKGREGYCCWLPPTKPTSSASWKQSYRSSNPAHTCLSPHQPVSSTRNGASCSRSCFCQR